MLEKLEALLSIFIVFYLLGSTIACLFILIASNIRAIGRYSFKKTIIASSFVSLLVHIWAAIFCILPSFNAIAGFSIGLLISFWALKLLCQSTLIEAFIIWILYVFAQLLAVLIGSYLFIGGIDDLMRIL